MIEKQCNFLPFFLTVEAFTCPFIQYFFAKINLRYSSFYVEQKMVNYLNDLLFISRVTCLEIVSPNKLNLIFKEELQSVCFLFLFWRDGGVGGGRKVMR